MARLRARQGRWTMVWLAVWLLVALLPPLVHGQEAPMTAPALMDQQVLDEAHEQWVQAELATWTKAADKDLEVMVRPGLRADRRTRTVELLAAATGLGEGVPTEFFICGAKGRAYESLSVTRASAADLRAALIFVGVPPGRPVAPNAMQFWPRGERVLMTLVWDEAEPATGKLRERVLRAEETVLDKRTGKPLPSTGLAFVSSLSEPGPDGQPVLLAESSGNLASNYNDPFTLLDVPYLADQGLVYGHLVPNPALKLAFRQRLRWRLTPALPAGQTSVRLYDLALSGTADASTADLRVTLTPPGGAEPALAVADFAGLLAFIQGQMAEGRECYASPRFADTLPIPALAEFCALLRPLNERGLLRLEAAPQEFYYEAFLPDPKWRDRAERMSQPIEVHLRAGPALAGKFVWIEERYQGDKLDLREQAFEFADAAGLAKVLAQREEWETRSVFYYLPPGVTLGQARAAHKLLGERLPIAYVWGKKE